MYTKVLILSEELALICFFMMHKLNYIPCFISQHSLNVLVICFGTAIAAANIADHISDLNIERKYSKQEKKYVFIKYSSCFSFNFLCFFAAFSVASVTGEMPLSEKTIILFSLVAGTMHTAIKAVYSFLFYGKGQRLMHNYSKLLVDDMELLTDEETEDE